MKKRYVILYGDEYLFQHAARTVSIASASRRAKEIARKHGKPVLIDTYDLWFDVDGTAYYAEVDNDGVPTGRMRAKMVVDGLLERTKN